MNIPPCFYRLSVKALIVDEQDRFLVAKEPDGKWDLPGGGLEYGEDLKTALEREIKEELGLQATKIFEQPAWFTTFKKAGTDIWMANAVHYVYVENFDFVPSDECVEIKFFTAKEAANLDNYGGITELAKIYNV